MGYFKAHQKTSALRHLRKHGSTKGLEIGFTPAKDVFTLLKGYPWFVAGAPHSGKTEVVIEVLLNMSVLHGWKHFVYLGENGDVEEVIADLCHKYICKPYKPSGGFQMSDTEAFQAEMFIDKHFVILDDEEDLTLKEFYQKAKEAEQEFDIKFDTTLFDPFNDIVDESHEMNGTHNWLNRDLKYVRRVSKQEKRVDIFINHIANIPTVRDQETGNFYKRPALPDEWAMGQLWHRRGYLMTLVYRPPAWLKNEHGEPYGENVSLITVQKAKPKGVATYGATLQLKWDWKYNRYYWEEFGVRKFAFMTNAPESVDIEPNNNFLEQGGEF